MVFSLSQCQTVTRRNKGLGKLKSLGPELFSNLAVGEPRGSSSKQAEAGYSPPRPAPAQTAAGALGEKLSLRSVVPWPSPAAAAILTSITLPLGHIFIILRDDAQGETAR